MKNKMLLVIMITLLMCLCSCKGSSIDDMIDDFNEIIMPASGK